MIGYAGSIKDETLKNDDFRRVLFTGSHVQLVVMCLEPSEDIGDETHQGVDQFFRIEEGEAKFVFNEKEVHLARSGDAIVIPSGTYHNVVNTSETDRLRVYTLYSPPNHADATVHRTKADAEAAEAAGSHQ